MKLNINQVLSIPIRRFLLSQPAPPPEIENGFKSQINPRFCAKKRGETHLILTHKYKF